MRDKSTNPGCRIGDASLGMPSFVRQLSNDEGDLTACFDFWAPATTGYGPLDYDLGRQHCRSAMACARQLGSANLLLYVVIAMHGRPLGDIDRGFIAELISPALVGAIPPLVSDELMLEIAKEGADIEALREQEQFMARALPYGRVNPELFFNYVVGLVSGDAGPWIGAAVYLLVGAALNGGLH